MDEHITREDYIHYDKVWQRVAPELNPYPAVRESESPPAPTPPTPAPPAAAPALTDYIDSALGQRCLYQRYATCAPTIAARRTMYRLAEEELCHARRLAALHYVATGVPYHVPHMEVQKPCLPWQELLRQWWQEECCSGEAFFRAAQAAENPCLRETLHQLSQEEFRHAESLLQLLEGNALA